jgi:tetratricopeptide (TPR) repeat protein/transglutaminase-like putative cysteine protease
MVTMRSSVCRGPRLLSPALASLLLLPLLAAPSPAEEPTLGRIWDAEWRASLEARSGLLDLAGLIDRFPPVPGLSPEAQREVATEFGLRLLHETALAIGRPDRALGELERFLETSPDPLNEGAARQLEGICRHLLGDAEGADRAWDALGYLADFHLIGPFENERGSGFASGGPPEERVDLSAEYPGKRGPVRWRRWSERGVAGQIELGELLRPDEEAMAYGVTWLEVDEATEAVLRVSSSGAYRIWLGDEEVASTDVERPLRFDQEAIPVRLQPGRNRLLFLSGVTKGPWALRIRVTDDAGGPLRGLVVSAEPPADPNAPSTQTHRREGATPQLGARGHLAEASPGFLSAALSGWIAAAVHAHDRNDHPDRDHYRRALELADGEGPVDRAILQLLLAESFRQEIDHAAEREENPRREALEEVIRLAPDFDRARFELAEYALDRFQNRTRASELLLPALEREVPAPAALELARRIEGARLGRALSLRWQRALEARLEEELLLPVRTRRLEELRSKGLLEEANALLDQGLRLSPMDPSLLRLRRERALREGDLETARGILLKQVAARPQSVGTWRRLAAFERSVDRTEAALAAIDRALLVAPQDEGLHEERGHLLRQLGLDAEALESWGEALALDPNQPKLRSLVEYLETSAPGIDGEFRIEVAERIAAALEESPEDKEPYRILLDNRVSDVQKDGTAIRYVQRVLQVLTDAGIRQLDFQVVPYAQGEQWVRVLKARVHHRDGGFADARIRNREPQKREGEYPVWSRAFVDLPPLRVGDVVEIEYLKEDLRQSFFGDYFGEEILFGGFLPRERTVYTVRFPEDRDLHHLTHDLDAPETTRLDGRTTWRWDTPGIAKIEPEPAGPPIEELVPRVEISTYETWDEFARWYHYLIRKQFESSPEIREKVGELVAGATSDLEKVRVIYEFVANEVRYIAWEFGVHGFLPYNANTIFTRRFGDCKDKATLICTMLDEVGIEAWPVLINGTRQRPKEDLSLPLVSHFNHCIAYVPGVDGGLFIDGTAEDHGVRQLPEMDRGAEIVVVRDDGAERHRIPWNSPDELAVVESSTVSIRDDGSAAIEQRSTFTGGYGTMVRDSFEVESKRAEMIERMLSGRFPGLEVREVRTSDLDDLTTDPTIELTLEVPRYADLGRGAVELPPIRDILETLDGVGNSASEPTREQDLLVGNPRGGSLRIEITLPEGYRVASLPEPISLAEDEIRCDFRFSWEEGRIVVEREYRIVTPRVTPEAYERFKQVVDTVETKLEERIVLEPGTEVN